MHGRSGHRCAVLGSPIGHSLSPVLHRAGYRAAGLDWTYDAVEVREDELAGFLDGLDGTWRGLSLTMPLKRVALALADEVSERAAQAGAVNTLLLEDGRRIGHNTDVPGAVAALRERYDGPLRRAVVLGGGATAASVLLALADLGCREATLLVREPGRARDTLAAASRHPAPPEVTVGRLADPPPEQPPDVVVSTIPAAAQTPAVLALAERAPVVFDVVYDPWPTPLASAALARDAVLVCGLDLLLHQAAGQFVLMTGLPEAPLEAMRVAGEEALASRL
jgi:shikimate dehydrogenase